MEEIEITVGTYENLILGYKIIRNVGGDFTLESSFTNDSHRGALRCLAMSPQGVLASSSTDDSIRLHSLKKRKEVGSLFQHDGSVNRIRFFKGGHMFSASEDGTICLWKCKNWELLRILKGHRCHVMSVAVHPSAKLGLSVGSDRTFFTWDLTTGKLAFKRKTEQAVQDILFTQDGNNYVLVYDRKMEVCSLEDTLVIQEICFDSRINSVCFVEDNIMAVGGDDGKLSVINVVKNEILLQETFKGRLKSLHCLTTKTDVLLFTSSSNGCIKMCRLDFTEGAEKLEILVDFESRVRITCITAYAPPDILKEEKTTAGVKDKRKRKRKANEEDGDCDADSENDLSGSDQEADEEFAPRKVELDLDVSESEEDAGEVLEMPVKKKKKEKKSKALENETDAKKQKKVDVTPKQKKKKISR